MLYNYFIIRLFNKYSTTIAAAPADNVQLVTGGHDQVCAAVGSGVIYDGLAVDGIGTVECIAPAFNRPVLNEKMLRFPFACVPHRKKGLVYDLCFSFFWGCSFKMVSRSVYDIGNQRSTK